MKRRTVLARLGAASVASAAFAGSTTASKPYAEVELDRSLDVSDLSGEYAMTDLLTEEEIAAAPDAAAVHERTIVIAPGAEEITTFSDCCCCDGSTPGCDGDCCEECPML